MSKAEPIVVTKPKKLLVPCFNKKEVAEIAKQTYFDNFGTDIPTAKVDDEIVSVEEAIDLLRNGAVGTSCEISNFIPGVKVELLVVAKNHYDLANEEGKASAVIICKTILNEYTYLGLPTEGDICTNAGGYPTALGLHEQLNAIFDKLAPAFQKAIKLVKIPCYLPKYEIGDALFISGLFVPSATELGFSHETAENVPESGDGTKYAYFDEGNEEDALAKRIFKFINGENGYYWTRTPYLSYPDFWCCVDNDGGVIDDGTNECYGLVFAFCL